MERPAGAAGLSEVGAGAPGQAPGAEAPGASAALCSQSGDGTRLPPRLILLSDYQHLRSLSALLGEGAVSAADAAENTPQTKPFSQKGVVVNGSLVHQRLSWASAASAALDARFQELTGCAPSASDDACARRFLAGFTARAFRRPVDDEELDDLMVVYTTAKAGGSAAGVKRAVEAALAAPSFMYRRELGAPDARGNVALTPHELASELSYFLSDAPPDGTLRAAADSGALADPAELARQVARMLDEPAVKDALSSTLMSAWGLGNLFGTAKDPTLYPEYTPQLQAAMYHETELFVRDVLWEREAPVAELLTSNTSFVNGALASLYGVSPSGAPDAFSPVMLPEGRAGLLTQPGVMAMLARTDTTSVVARGLFVRGSLLCMPKVPAPPESLGSAIQDLLKADMTERQRADARAQNATCAGCHANIDPFGLLLEGYDPVGRLRSTLRGAPIDTHAEVVAGTISGPYEGAVPFADAAATSREFDACIRRHVLAYATQNDALSRDDCAVEALAPNGSALTFPALVQAVASSAALRLRTPEEP